MILDWYFDFVSPYAYLQFQRLRELPAHVTVHRRPVLFAALLDRWGQLGPAEIAPKRLATYRQVLWLAHRDGVPLTLPSGHPFNSLPLLRLAIALGATHAVVGRLFDYVWVEGSLPQDPERWSALCAELGLASSAETPEVKEALRRETADAAARGVFGVPTACVDDQSFWGYDATDMLLEYCRDPAAFRTRPYGTVPDVPIAAARPRARDGGAPAT